MSEPLVIIGNGMAAAKLVEELSRRALGRYAIAVIGEEPRLAYNRVLLSSVLAGEIASSDIDLKPACWWRSHGVTLRYGCKATAVDLARRHVLLEDGESIAFAKLVFATGSQPLRLPIPGADLPGVHTFRGIADIDALTRLGENRQRVVVIGGGLLGLEAAYGLVKAGAAVTLVHLMDRLMERQLDGPAAALLKRLVEQKGVEILLNANTSRIHGEGRVTKIEFADGATLGADAVVFAAGIRPNSRLARDSGIATNRGVVVDDGLRTSVRGVYALGECAEHRGICYGLVEPAYEQARVLAARLTGSDDAYHGSVVATNLKVSGVNVFSAGEFLGDESTEEIIWSDPVMGVYKKLVLANDRLVGAVLVGDTRDAIWYVELMRAGADVSSLRDGLIFGKAIMERQAA
jgi:nitrite reductase (NADH) large subunit